MAGYINQINYFNKSDLDVEGCENQLRGVFDHSDYEQRLLQMARDDMPADKRDHFTKFERVMNMVGANCTSYCQKFLHTQIHFSFYTKIAKTQTIHL